MDYEVEGVRRRGRPKKTWSVVVEKDFRSQNYIRRMLWTTENGESQLRHCIGLITKNKRFMVIVLQLRRESCSENVRTKMYVFEMTA